MGPIAPHRPSRRALGEPPRPPVRLFKECAEANGLSPQTLLALRRRHPGFPASLWTSKRRDFYDPREVRAWLRALDAASTVPASPTTTTTPTEEKA